MFPPLNKHVLGFDQVLFFCVNMVCGATVDLNLF